VKDRDLIWLAFVEREIEANGFITKKEAIAAGAMEAGCSTESTRRYLAKFTSSLAPYELINTGGEIVMVSK